MGTAALGTKCTCAGCGARFYDLNRLPAICPKCGAQQAAPSRRAAAVAIHARRPYRPPAPLVAELDLPEAADDDAEAAEDEQDADLEEPDSDIDSDIDIRTTPDPGEAT